jgi:exodeoxyribonuclease III
LKRKWAGFKMKIISWNVNGIRAAKQKGLFEFMQKENAEIYCLQEIKISSDLVDSSFDLSNYKKYFFSAEKKGYSGTAIYSKEEPLAIIKGIGIEKYDSEGRIITVELPNFFLMNIYFPNTQPDLGRLEFKLEFDKEIIKFANKLSAKKDIIITGDFNVAHKEIDLTNPKTNVKSAGFTIEERNAFTEILNNDYIDTFRYFNKEPGHYTWWSYRFNARARNIGWRIDYFLVNKAFIQKVKSSKILKDIMGSDHCPISLEFN